METLDEFFADRASWLHMTTSRNEHGTYDVVLVIDGCYATRDMAEEMATHFRRRLHPALPNPMQLTDWFTRR